MSKYAKEIEKRRTFAIISHPDAGKTTLTEKIPSLWRRHQSGRYGKGPQGGKACSFRLDGY